MGITMSSLNVVYIVSTESVNIYILSFAINDVPPITPTYYKIYGTVVNTMVGSSIVMTSDYSSIYIAGSAS